MSGDLTIGLTTLDNSSDSLSSHSNLSVGALPNSLILGNVLTTSAERPARLSVCSRSAIGQETVVEPMNGHRRAATGCFGHQLCCRVNYFCRALINDLGKRRPDG